MVIGSIETDIQRYYLEAGGLNAMAARLTVRMSEAALVFPSDTHDPTRV